MIIDTHAHLYLSQFEDDLGTVIRRCKENDVQKVLLPNIDTSTIDAMLQLETLYSGICFPMMGLHPCSVGDDPAGELQIIGSWLKKRNFCAVGEIGIDLHWRKDNLEQQKSAFLQQVKWAVDIDRPIVIHSRNSTGLILDMLEELQETRLKGVFHCFSGNLEEAKRVMQLGMYMGIGGVVTYKNARALQDALAEIPLEWLLLETDAPYLAPVPHRGKRNESAYARIVAERLAEIKGLPLEEVCAQTTRNAFDLFDIY